MEGWRLHPALAEGFEARLRVVTSPVEEPSTLGFIELGVAHELFGLDPATYELERLVGMAESGIRQLFRAQQAALES